MAATSTPSYRSGQGSAPFRASRQRPRRISPEAGRALEILGHAIEYLADEYRNSWNLLAADESQLEALQILMERNRQIYAECPLIPTFAERCRALFSGLFHSGF